MARTRIIALDNLQQFAAVKLNDDAGYIGGPKIIDQCAEISIAWVITGGKVVYNVLHGRYTGSFAGSQAQANSIHTGLASGAQWTAMAAFMPTTGGISSVSIRNLDIKDQPLITSNAAAGLGTSASAALPGEVAAVLTLRTAFTGRANRGRIYVPNFATNALGAADTIAANAVTAIANWGAIIAGVLNAQGYLFCIGHVARAAYTGASGTQHPARVDGTVPVQTVVVRDNHWDSQRRRGQK